jgi:hypothetical protein
MFRLVRPAGGQIVKLHIIITRAENERSTTSFADGENQTEVTLGKPLKAIAAETT